MRNEKRFTLAMLEQAEHELAQGDSGRHNNPSRTRSWNKRWRAYWQPLCLFIATTLLFLS